MKTLSILMLVALTGCSRSAPTVCSTFRPSAPYTSPRLEGRDRELLEVDGEYAAFNEGLLCGSLR